MCVPTQNSWWWITKKARVQNTSAEALAQPSRRDLLELSRSGELSQPSSDLSESAEPILVPLSARSHRMCSSISFQCKESKARWIRCVEWPLDLALSYAWENAAARTAGSSLDAKKASAVSSVNSPLAPRSISGKAHEKVTARQRLRLSRPMGPGKPLARHHEASRT